MASTWTAQRCEIYQGLCLKSFQSVTWPHASNVAFKTENMAEWGLHKCEPKGTYKLDKGDDGNYIDDCVICHCCRMVCYNWKLDGGDKPEDGHFAECFYKAWHCGRTLLFAPEESDADMDVSEPPSGPQHHSTPGIENLPRYDRAAQIVRAHLYDAVAKQSSHFLLQCASGCGQPKTCMFAPCGHISHCMTCAENVQPCKVVCPELGTECKAQIVDRIAYRIV